MKTKILTIIIFLAFVSSYGQSFLDVDLNLKGSVDSIIETEFKVIKESGTVIKGDPIDCSEKKYVFDENMRIIQEEFCIMGFPSSYNYEYDSDEKLIRRTRKSKFGNHNQEYEYDRQGNQIQKLTFDRGRFVGRWTYKYDENGNRIKRTGYLEESFVERWIMEYDEDNKKVLEYMVSEEPDNTPTTFYIKYKYDDQNRLIEVIETKPDSKDNRQFINKYQYNDKGDVIYHYSKNDFHFKGSREVTKTYQYEYDQKNNWIKRVEFENKTPTIITIREMKYRN